MCAYTACLIHALYACVGIACVDLYVIPDLGTRLITTARIFYQNSSEFTVTTIRKFHIQHAHPKLDRGMPLALSSCILVHALDCFLFLSRRRPPFSRHHTAQPAGPVGG